MKRYIDGEYDTLKPTRVTDNFNKEMYRLLKPKKERKITSFGPEDIWQIENMINLPRNLYLLHLLQQGILKN